MTEVVVDTSVFMALMLHEPDAEAYMAALAEVQPLMGLPTRVEYIHVVLRRLGTDAVAEAEGLLEDFSVRFAPFDERQAQAALSAVTAYGRGRGREPAVLNFGDLFAYALAKTSGLPLMYKGDDFGRTDVRRHSVLPPPLTSVI